MPSAPCVLATHGYASQGVVIMFLHDSSDVVIDLLKLCNYLNLEGLSGCFAVEVCFITNFVTWAYARLYVFPVHVIYLAVMTASPTPNPKPNPYPQAQRLTPNIYPYPYLQSYPYP